MELINLHALISVLIFSGIGIVVLISTFVLIDLLTPHYHIWKEIVEKQNTALAVLLGAFTIGIALIIAAAVHG
jgi:uncharacterized membrane protein YjfL (UPF0719 family)